MNELMEPGEPSPEMIEILKRELQSGETLVWKAAPDRDAFVRANRGSRVLGFIFMGFSLFWMGGVFLISGAAKKPAPFFFPLFGIPFFVIGVIFAFGLAWAGRRRAERSIFGLTHKRAIVIEGSWHGDVRNVYSFRAERLKKMSKREGKDGSGDLIFEQVDAGYTQNNRAVYRPRGFLGIRNVHQVEALVRSTLKVD